ncbi:MAG: hypothetical protein JOZ47_21440 [Kutzneria sp.]|nr:hypothetical protein [Kutzneria sp.]MBV9847612.1 hypothetical protein [Kutzneria sp.]
MNTLSSCLRTRLAIQASGFIGYSASAERVLVVIAYRDLDGELHGMNAWPASGRDLVTYRKRCPMTKKLDEQTARADARALEAEADTTGPYPPGTRIVRPNRPSRMFNVRLTDEQFAELQGLACDRHLPMSTMARSWLLERLDQERHAC